MERWQDLLIYAALVFLVIQALFGIFSWIQIAKQNALIVRILDDSRLGERAWMSPDKPRLDSLITDQRPEVVVTYRNTGKTPAKILLSQVTVTTVQANVNVSEIGAPSENLEDAQPINFVAPNGLFYDVPDESLILTDARIKQIEGGDQKLIVFATCMYRDEIENRIRRTTCSFWWSPSLKQLLPHNLGNYMD